MSSTSYFELLAQLKDTAPATSVRELQQALDDAKSERERKDLYQLYASTSISSNPYDGLDTDQALRKALRAVQKEQHEIFRESFRPWMFALGVLDTLLLGFFVTARPQDFWWVWGLHVLALVSYKIYRDCVARPLCQVFYYFEYCWVMNFVVYGGVAALVLCHHLSDPRLYALLLACAIGPLFGAAGVLGFCALVFHDRVTMTALLAHMSPSMLLYTFLWQLDSIERAWPDVFPTALMRQVHAQPYISFDHYWTTPAGLATAFYGVWFVLYSVWMSVWGLHLTRTRSRKDGRPIQPRFDGAFQSYVNKGFLETTGRYLWNRPLEETKRQMAQGDYEFRDFVVYMLQHSVAILFSTNIVGWTCFGDPRIHAAWLTALVMLAAYRGGTTYATWWKQASDRAIQRQYHLVLLKKQQ